MGKEGRKRLGLAAKDGETLPDGDLAIIRQEDEARAREDEEIDRRVREAAARLRDDHDKG